LFVLFRGDCIDVLMEVTPHSCVLAFAYWVCFCDIAAGYGGLTDYMFNVEYYTVAHVCSGLVSW